jgi:hypothetical protein
MKVVYEWVAPQLGMSSYDPKGNDRWMPNFIVFKQLCVPN